ncbi:hypothetical protein TSOC_000980, partial [Tetrabaena socialis]
HCGGDPEVRVPAAPAGTPVVGYAGRVGYRGLKSGSCADPYPSKWAGGVPPAGWRTRRSGPPGRGRVLQELPPLWRRAWQ